MKTLLATASVLGLLAAPVLAQTSPPSGSAAPSARAPVAPSGAMSGTGDKSAKKQAGLSKQDRDFVHDAALDGMTEVEEGKLAQQHGMSQGVKDYGRTIATDHAQANDQLKSIAQGKGVQIPSDLDRSHRRDLDKLAKAKSFDRDFVRGEVKDHEKAVKLFQKEAQSGQDPELKQFAQQTLPKLQQHLQMAQQLDQQARGSKGSQTSSLPRGGTSGSSTTPTAPSGATGAPTTTR